MRRVKWGIFLYGVLTVGAAVTLFSTLAKRHEHASVQRHYTNATLLREAPQGSQFAMALARSMPTANGHPWYGLCPKDRSRDQYGVSQEMHRLPHLRAFYRIAPDAWAVARDVYAQGGEQVLISYQQGGAIYWRRDPVTLEAGERLTLVGGRLIRAACCNEVRTVGSQPQPMLPRELEPPAEDVGLLRSDTPGPATPLATAKSTIGSGAAPEVALGRQGRGYVPISSGFPVTSGIGGTGGGGVIIPGGGGGGTLPPSPAATILSPTPIPEPGTWVMVATGAALLVGGILLRRKRDTWT